MSNNSKSVQDRATVTTAEMMQRGSVDHVRLSIGPPL